MVTMPLPRLISADFWDWAIRQPDSPVKALATHRPTVVVNTGLMEEERTMSGLLPVARMARRRRVFRKAVRKATVKRRSEEHTSELQSR